MNIPSLFKTFAMSCFQCLLKSSFVGKGSLKGFQDFWPTFLGYIFDDFSYKYFILSAFKQHREASDYASLSLLFGERRSLTKLLENRLPIQRSSKTLPTHSSLCTPAIRLPLRHRMKYALLHRSHFRFHTPIRSAIFCSEDNVRQVFDDLVFGIKTMAFLQLRQVLNFAVWSLWKPEWVTHCLDEE